MLPIVISPDPILATVCEPCEPGDKSLKRLSKQMAHAMYKNYGCGIAAPQVGVNPEIVELAGEPEEGGEGCLSCPGVTVPVKRQPWARVQYYDLDGELWEIEGDGLLGRCLQHEIDHLNGKTLFESCDPVTRIEALRAYEEAKAAGARPGDTDIEVK